VCSAFLRAWIVEGLLVWWGCWPSEWRWWGEGGFQGWVRRLPKRLQPGPRSAGWSHSESDRLAEVDAAPVGPAHAGFEPMC